MSENPCYFSNFATLAAAGPHSITKWKLDERWPYAYLFSGPRIFKKSVARLQAQVDVDHEAVRLSMPGQNKRSCQIDVRELAQLPPVDACTRIAHYDSLRTGSSRLTVPSPGVMNIMTE